MAAAAPQRAPGVGQAAVPAVQVDERVAEAAPERQAEAEDPRVQDPACPRRVGSVRTCVERVAGVALSGEGREEAGVVGGRVGVARRVRGARGGGAEGWRSAGLGRGAEERCGGGTHVPFGSLGLLRARVASADWRFGVGCGGQCEGARAEAGGAVCGVPAAVGVFGWVRGWLQLQHRRRTRGRRAAREACRKAK